MRCAVALLALAACAYARTATRAPSVSAQITSLTDKDARHKAMVHPAFANAGKSAGVEIWRIEDFNPVPVPAKDYGKFYKGDSYIVLKTSADKRNNLSWDIHYWLGSATSQDEAGAAAILTVGLDDKFGGAAIQHRETLGYESPQFLGYFQPAIRYLDGGHASGFSHVTTNAGAEKRLFQVKGKRNVRVRQVDPLISSMNKGDCFILDVDHDIYVYVGEKAKMVERLKAISVANQVRDQDHNGRGRVEIIDQYSSESDVQKFFTALGSGSRESVPEDTAGGDDQAFERNEEQTVTLSEISDSTGKLKITPLSKPYRQDQLKPQECYILDTVSGSIYVWVGKQSTEKEKSEAMSKAQQYLAAKNYPSWVHVTRVPQGTEPAAFKQYFTTWRDVGMSHSRLVRSASDEELYSSDTEVSSRRARSVGKTGTLRGYTPDGGHGESKVFQVDIFGNNEIVNGVLHQGDAYYILYKTRDGHSILYTWIGNKASNIEDEQAKETRQQFTESLDNSIAFRVPQGQEPKHLLSIFKGLLVTVMGEEGSAKNEKRLFKIHGTTAGVDTIAEEVPLETSSVHPDDVFLLELPEQVILWFGEGSSSVEQQVAEQFADKIAPTKPVVSVNQGQEEGQFWEHLAGSPESMGAESWRSRLHRRVGIQPTLHEATISSDNTVSFDQMPLLNQREMDEDEVFVLDDGEELYVWTGKEVTDHLRKSVFTIAQEYQRRHSAGHTPVVIAVKQGLEPAQFTALFEDWDAQMWQKKKSYEQEKEDALKNNEIE